jgi:putative membrane protein
LLDELLGDEGVRGALLNLPFGVVAVGLVVRGFTAYFLERGGEIPPLTIPRLSIGAITVTEVTLSVWERLALFVVTGVVVSLVGVRFASYLSAREVEGLPENT